MNSVDQYNRNPIGKIFVEVRGIKHLPFYNNIFIRLTCDPYVVETAKILKPNLNFDSKFYIPLHNYFSKLKIEIFNLHSDGWFTMHTKDQLIESYEIKIPYIDKEPFDEFGSIKLPISELIDHKRLGLKKVEDTEN